MNHKQKKKMARKMLTREEIENHAPIFLSEAWEKRKEAIKIRVKKRNDLLAKVSLE